MSRQLDNFLIDAFKEIGSIGMGNATTSLSKLIEKRVQLNLSDARLFEPSAIVDMIPDSITMTSIMMPVHGDLNGVAMMLFEFGNAVYLSNLLLQSIEHDDDPSIYESALLETGNIIAGSYLNSLASFLDLKIMHSVPDISIGTIDEILERGLAKMQKEPEGILNIETMFMVYSSEKDVGAGTIYGDMFLLLDSESLDRMQNSIQEMLK
ncbi:MAG: chemotaxis protein CheC [Methanolobus sp.]|jgi:chemotaxis protein CheC|uniref:Chemotaxis protein CheC, inhibitor of MCP methylation n=1 Tax=Methanolobus tindarius DSM 2278 TaxID=1090322 RepID=W9DU89_METTI|nr:MULTISPECIES: chemotaxis protein CheC [Methanolobus]ETA67237.1 chemotaxis protein CheC, inhibitor of MCP methylation [Methanolobus tindarius DSM 2278]MDI3486428.1 chemotaxis protein CheC [Methanolobus sp.]MDK2832365.1 chemotaxis protein CheC [Methanolobus sp.]MDK2939191.1 chemotaxis protein CheC [Methanolobus sp.]